jgi:hypothetical protein
MPQGIRSVTDARLEPILQTGASRLQAAASQALEKVAKQLPALALASTSNVQRQSLMNAERALGLKSAIVLSGFARELALRIDKTSRLANGDTTGNTSSEALLSSRDTDWTSLTLVDNAEVERGVTAEKLGQLLTHDCDVAVASLNAHMASLLHDSSPDRNAFRPQVVAQALLKALADAEPDQEVVDAISQQLGRVLGPELSQAYTLLVSDMRTRGIEPQSLAVQRNKGHSVSGHSGSGAATQNGELSINQTRPDQWQDSAAGQSHSQAHTPTHADTHLRAAQALSNMFGVSLPGAPLEGPVPMGMRQGRSADFIGPAAAAQANFQNLLKRISQQPGMADWQAMQPQAQALDSTGQEHAAAPGFAGPLMAVNQIRAHREELVRASGGAALDQMVIDIVAALFDQVLSDPKVAPEMARQIARLQMPVLRVALGDMGFFNSRKHPVRRFVNRIATLSAVFEDHDEGAGQACLARVTALVNDIVDGDFDRMDIYEAKLTELEQFIESENTRDNAENAAVAAILSGKEADLRVQQRYMQILKHELADVEMPDFVREFISQIWSQVQVMAAARDGAHSPFALRMRKAGHELALSVQPKGNPALRKAFLLKLPQLMKDLNEGLALIQWSEDAKQAFYGQLLPAHADGLKAAPQHDLTTRLIEQRLNKVEQLAIPSREEAANDPLPESLMEDIKSPPLLTVVSALSREEIQQAGFVPEATISSEALDIDLDAPAGSVDPCLSEVDINLDAPATPTAGLQLVHHIHKGTAYQMMMQGEWKKVRLTWVSDGRNFFIFTQGQVHKKTISLTARTLAKMCDTGRFKAFEQSELIERATVRARRQLAALSQQAAPRIKTAA